MHYNGMQDEEELRLQFARQLYDECLKTHGEDHQETRLLQEYLSNQDRRRTEFIASA